MSGKAAKIRLTTCMHKILRQLASSRTIAQATVARVNMILMAFDKHSNQTSGGQLGCSAKTVGKWRRRWRDSFEALLAMQFTENQAAFRRAILECLRDAPSRGSLGKFTAEEIVSLIGIACEPPADSGRPVETWTGKELVDEAQKRGVIDSISASHVNRILRDVDFKPHLSQYWCNTTEKDL